VFRDQCDAVSTKDQSICYHTIPGQRNVRLFLGIFAINSKESRWPKVEEIRRWSNRCQFCYCNDSSIFFDWIGLRHFNKINKILCIDEYPLQNRYNGCLGILYPDRFLQSGMWFVSVYPFYNLSIVVFLLVVLYSCDRLARCFDEAFLLYELRFRFTASHRIIASYFCFGLTDKRNDYTQTRCSCPIAESSENIGKPIVSSAQKGCCYLKIRQGHLKRVETCVTQIETQRRTLSTIDDYD
jgi:hypothetical protein